MKEIANGYIMERAKILGMKDFSGNTVQNTSSLFYNVQLNTNKDTRCNIPVLKILRFLVQLCTTGQKHISQFVGFLMFSSKPKLPGNDGDKHSLFGVLYFSSAFHLVTYKERFSYIWDVESMHPLLMQEATRLCTYHQQVQVCRKHQCLLSETMTPNVQFSVSEMVQHSTVLALIICVSSKKHPSLFL